MNDDTKSLVSARSGEVLKVCRLETANDDSIRLKRLGICEDRTIQVVQAGDPMIVRVIGSRLGISRLLATQVYTKPCDETATGSQESHEGAS